MKKGISFRMEYMRFREGSPFFFADVADEFAILEWNLCVVNGNINL